MLDFLLPKVPQVTVDEVHESLIKAESCIVIDVRTDQEYARSHIEHSHHIPLDAIPTTVETVVLDKNAKIYVYCLSGSRSLYAVDAMRKFGYTNVFDMKNGLLGWRSKHYPEI